MEKVKIVTDSTCYLPKEVIEKYDIIVVPLSVRFGEDMFKEHLTINDEEFYERLKSGELADTTQPSADEFLSVYRPLIENGYSIISMHLSAGISGTLNSANAAKEALKTDKVWIFDTKFTSLGLGYQVLEVAKMIFDEGKSLKEVLDEIPNLSSHMHIFFLVGDLFYLARLGRIGKASAVMGTIIKIKPILYFDDGVVNVLEQPRTMKRGKERMIKLVKDITSKKGLKYMTVAWGANKEEAEEYKNQCEKEFGIEIPLTRLGPTIGSHVGPEVLSIHFYTEK
jgi:DegV family protein with EDD domain